MDALRVQPGIQAAIAQNLFVPKIGIQKLRTISLSSIKKYMKICRCVKDHA
jgi:hypothetical protein